MIHVYHPDWNHQGRFLVFGYGIDTPTARTPLCYLWTPPADGQPGNGTWQQVENTRTNLFCCGHCLLPDGRVLTAGGQFLINQPGQPATKHTDIFTPTSTGGSWSAGPDMAYGRWYPTCTPMPDGKALITSGTVALNSPDVASVMELFDPVTPPQVHAFAGAGRELPVPSYPFVRVIDEPRGDGRWRVVYAGGEQSGRWIVGAANMNDWGNWEPPFPPAPPSFTLYNWAHAERSDCTAVQSDPNMILKMGGLRGAEDLRGARTVSRFYRDPLSGYVWDRHAGLNKPRCNANTVLLPDRRIAVIGGNNRKELNNPEPWIEPVLTAEFIDPLVSPANGLPWPETEGTMAGSDGRTYHSSAVLLPDSRVLVAGGEPGRKNAQFLKPPYFAASRRPSLLGAPAELVYGQSGYQLTFEYVGEIGALIAPRVVLMGLNAATHGYDQNQRYLELEVTGFEDQDPLLVTFKAPPNARVAPPGYYMLFAVSIDVGPGYLGVPCRNPRYIRVRAGS
jgi:hypothetical protein